MVKKRMSIRIYCVQLEAEKMLISVVTDLCPIIVRGEWNERHPIIIIIIGTNGSEADNRGHTQAQHRQQHKYRGTHHAITGQQHNNTTTHKQYMYNTQQHM